MADKKDAEKKPAAKSNVAAFESDIDTQHKYLFFELATVEQDVHSAAHGAERFLPHVASHELLHALGFDHPVNPTPPGEEINARTWGQIREDITPQLLSRTYKTVDAFTRRETTFTQPPSQPPLGRLNPITGKYIVTYSFDGDTDRIKSSHPDLSDVRNVNDGDKASDEEKKQNLAVRTAMLQAFAEQSSQFGVIFKEATNPSEANIHIFTGTIPPSPEAAVSLNRDENPLTVNLNGHENPYTTDVTIMTYNRLADGVHPRSAVGDTYAGQMIYGLPVDDPRQQVITAERLADHAGSLYYQKPMAIKLTQSPMLGTLTIDMGAHPYVPAITGVLKDKDGDWQVREHIARDASIHEIDATGSNINLDVTGTLGAKIKMNKDATVRLKGRDNDVTVGAGNDTIKFVKGFGNVVTGFAKDDNITAADVKKAAVEYWNTAHEKGTLVTFVGDDDKNKGSLFIKDKTPDEVTKHLKNITRVYNKPPVALDAVNGDSELSAKPGVLTFNEATDVVVSADKAVGWGLSHKYGGVVILKMSQAQYDSRTIEMMGEGEDRYINVAFLDGKGDEKNIALHKSAKIAVTGPDGKIIKVAAASESSAAAIDKDKDMEKAPEKVDFKDEKDVSVTAQLAANHTLSNAGKGTVMIKMTRPEYESRTITPTDNGYSISFRDADGTHETRVEKASKIAITALDGAVERVVSVKDALEEFKLDTALRKGAQLESTAGSLLASLPYKARPFEVEKG